MNFQNFFFKNNFLILKFYPYICQKLHKMKKQENNNIPEMIRNHLDSNGTKQSWLAEKTGISQAHISNVLADRVLLTKDVLNKINEVLGTDFKN